LVNLADRKGTGAVKIRVSTIILKFSFGARHDPEYFWKSGWLNRAESSSSRSTRSSSSSNNSSGRPSSKSHH